MLGFLILLALLLVVVVKNKFNGPASSTYVPSSNNYNIEYGTGSAVVNVFTDNVQFGNIALTQINFGQATSLDSQFVGVPMDGIVGLGYPSIAAGGVLPPMDYMIKQGVLTQNVVSFYMDSTNLSKASEVEFGGIDNTHFSGQLTYEAVTTQGYWQIHLKSMAVGGNKLNLCSLFGCVAIIDTGTSVIALPQGDYTKVASAIGKVNADCSNQNSLPPVQITLASGTVYTIPSSIYVVNYGTPTQPSCQLGLMPFDYPLIILGDTFIRAYYSVFDRQNNRVGLGQAQ